MTTQGNPAKDDGTRQLLVKEILNRKHLKFRLPKENQEAKIYISFRNYEDEPGYIDVKIYKLHGAFCVSLEHNGHEIVADVFESGQKAISEIYSEMADIVNEWELSEFTVDDVTETTYGWMR